MKLHGLLERLFGSPEEINGGGRCSTYLYRWHVLKARWFKLYLHHFVGSDWSRDLHDHPKRFITIGLRGEYLEETPDSPIVGLGTQYRTYRAPWIRSFAANHIHRIIASDCWTLAIVLRGTREWGFWHNGRFIHWKSYVYGPDKHIADQMKDCA